MQTTSNQKLLRRLGSVPSITWILLGLGDPI